MPTIYLYTKNRDFDNVEAGPVTLDGALATAKRFADELQPQYEWGEDAIVASVFGFHLDDDTFLEIDLDPAHKCDVRFGPVTTTRKIFFVFPVTEKGELTATVTLPDGLDALIRAFFTMEIPAFTEFIQMLPQAK